MKQRLPEYESAYLNSLPQHLIRDRVRDLCADGWSLAAIAEAFDPPKSRSSIRAWSISKSPRTTHTHPSLPPSPFSPSSSSDKQIPAREKSSVSAPAHAPTPAPKVKIRRRVYDPTQPKISPAQKKKIARLAPLARRHRARTGANNTYTRANRELTDVCKSLYYSGASVRELSLAAGVTYRAMARRLGR
jgi:hypothetical protein